MERASVFRFSTLEILAHPWTGKLPDITANGSVSRLYGTFDLLDIENEQTPKDTRISFLYKIFQKTLKIPKSEFNTLKDTTSIPTCITLLWKCPLPSVIFFLQHCDF